MKGHKWFASIYDSTTVPVHPATKARMMVQEAGSQPSGE